jgi:hypothetical protein
MKELSTSYCIFSKNGELAHQSIAKILRNKMLIDYVETFKSFQNKGLCKAALNLLAHIAYDLELEYVEIVNMSKINRGIPAEKCYYESITPYYPCYDFDYFDEDNSRQGVYHFYPEEECE